MLNRVDRILLRVPNVAAATRFYTDTLGLTVDRQQSAAAALKFGQGATELVLHSDPHRADVEIVFGVDDVRGIYARRAQLGVTFVQAPQEAGQGYRATIRDPFGNVLVIADRARAGTAIDHDAAPAGGALFEDAPDEAPSQDRAQLVAIYTEIGRTADDLPYTRHFEELYSRYTRSLPEPRPTPAEVWRQLLTLRKKKGGLPRLGPAISKPPDLAPEDREHLRALLGDAIGRRDRLPYTEQFDQLVTDFNKRFARPYTAHIVWRLVATLAK